MLGPDHHFCESIIYHRRLQAKPHKICVRSLHLLLDMHSLSSTISHWWFAINRPGLISFHDRDHGLRKQHSSTDWAMQLLDEYHIPLVDTLKLLTMPRILGSVFNPVSFWLAFRQQQLVAVICEVNNTFGESHSYLCAHEDGRPIESHDWLWAKKQFHVSPFMDRSGNYRFRFSLTNNAITIAIHLMDGQQPLLVTSIHTSIQSLNKPAVLKRCWKFPWLAIKVITSIHAHAAWIWMKGIAYRKKPEAIKPNHSRTESLKED